MSKALVWSDFNREAVHELTISARPSDSHTLVDKAVQLKLADILGMSADIRRTPKDVILLNLLCQFFMFADTSEFGEEQISTLLSIILNVHRTSMENVLTMEESFEYFKDLCIRHSVQRPPFSVQIFTLNQLKPIQDFTLKAYYQFYGLYMHAFGKKEERDFKPVGLLHEVPPILPPLKEAITEEAFLEAERKRKEEEEEKTKEQSLETQSGNTEGTHKQPLPREIEELDEDVRKAFEMLRDQMNARSDEQMKKISEKLEEIERKLGIKK
eukprot:TRINITY_DN10299_c0_g1_i1.p2 TRINITY_DN10299_c0_g1~~TRINITY_DN10299_c0_g1_i1.p2  ORF type:complete len:270 (+),score=92.18 TRINITY_DN10299_c0_g1_i1:80-889(+)